VTLVTKRPWVYRVDCIDHARRALHGCPVTIVVTLRNKHCVDFSPREDAEKDWALFQQLRAM
jgi:hypothetical protein